MLLYALKDLKMGSFGPVMAGLNDAHMSRIIHESLSGQGSTPARYPADYDLYQVGEYDADKTGAITGSMRYVCSLEVILTNPGAPNA